MGVNTMRPQSRKTLDAAVALRRRRPLYAPITAREHVELKVNAACAAADGLAYRILSPHLYGLSHLHTVRIRR